MLVRKAAKLFAHAKDIIAKTSLASSIAQEYSALLRAHLLPVPQYCNVVSSTTFQGSCLVLLPSTPKPTTLTHTLPHYLTGTATHLQLYTVHMSICKRHTADADHVSVQHVVQPHVCPLRCCAWGQSCSTCTWVSLRKSSLTEARTPSGTCPACCYCCSSSQETWNRCSSKTWSPSLRTSCPSSTS